ncbi:MAG TPA: energy transducer TonB [Terracidiphilus sp.]|nr:energy transducer TonB [Terracidiphilus sp.]
MIERGHDRLRDNAMHAMGKDIIATTMRLTIRFLGLMFFAIFVALAQKPNRPTPDSLVIARDTFWDMGPPLDYYDLIQITKNSDGLALDQVLVTPHGDVCFQPAKVEERRAVLHESMSDLLGGRNPCAIPVRELNREIKRCKKCPVFSGVNVTMLASCNGKDRQIRMDILDRDIYDNHPQTPANTSWTMELLSRLQDVLGPGSESEPIFDLGAAERHSVPEAPLANAIRRGDYDSLFGKGERVSAIVVEAGLPSQPQPSVEVVSVGPILPTTSVLPKYPPIAIAARLSGTVEATFDVDAGGKAENIAYLNGDRLKMLQLGVSDALATWKFPESARGKTESAQIRFNLNCGPQQR